MNKKESELKDSIEQKFLNNLLGTLTVEEAKYILKKGTGNFCDEVIDCAADVLIEEMERLERKEQKIIERIENEEICCVQKNNRIENIVLDEAKKQIEVYKKHILEILKGENIG